MKLVLSLYFLIFVLLKFANAQDDFKKEIVTGKYKINLSNNESSFFTGVIKVVDKKNNKVVFEADSIYSRYNWDTLIDLNNDGSNELILDLGTGATMYDYNVFLIFDFNISSQPLFEIHNADLITNVDNVPKIVSNVRLSPNYLGAGYSYSLRYDKGNLILETDPNESKVLISLTPDDKDEIELMSNFKQEGEECEEGSQYITYFEAYVTQMKILNQEKKGWKFFNKYYNCKDKEKARINLKKIVNENYSHIKNENFKFESLK